MLIEPLSIDGAWEITPKKFGDPRGLFMEAFRGDLLAEVIGHPFDLQQANLSVSAAGVLRGVHFADVPPGQAKYVSCPRGAIFDVVVDIRVGSPTFGAWDGALLDDVDRRALYIGEGLGHAFVALEDNSVVTYLCSTGYNPAGEHGINPLDPAIGIEFPTTARDGSDLTFTLSDKDTAAPTLAEAEASGLLPEYTDVIGYIRSLTT
ncbi:dTDP-4-dehydrorhamnose 3,5-epimerase family protein [Williamsia sp. DF01-3]|uniref:dTDP-4-dehydrorhamnose 3,5-epimerase family protein n=1 Tax=Williamsia sp. DF01-3 TaxID=2934157 RepID=UPI001FF37CDF|nr:dTDP-4-dehydrorhamnose 3,5-epimerase [Williamsia sp. DF01-3]MCK0516997.1 dTDP-4-dehydrorhamnose 3,5-epimerase [Williamsia sp. DF01-3]